MSGGIERHAAHLPEISPGGWVTLGEGNTPLVPLPRVGRRLGLTQLYAKLEHLNPTGSYKDRIAAMSMSLAVAAGARGWIATSSGNAGTALAAYGARAGLRGILVVVPNIPREKLLPVLAVGTSVQAVDGLGSGGDPRVEHETFELVKATAERHELFLAITAHEYNPSGMRGADTVGHEIAGQIEADVIYVPTGGGGLLTALARGLIDAGRNVPVVAAQPEGCAPIVETLAGRRQEPVVTRCTSRISGLQLPAPPDGRRAVDAVTSSRGWGTAVADDEILRTRDLLAHHEGLFVEPAAAVGLAAAARDGAEGRLSPEQHVVVVITGAGWKDLSHVASAHALEALSIDALPSALDRLVTP